MRTRQIKRVAFSTVAAVLLLTGVLNVRSVIGGGDTRFWDVDPSGPSATDQIVGISDRLPTKLDAQILTLQDRLRMNPNEGQAAMRLGWAYIQKVREVGDPSYYPKAEALFKQALARDDKDYAAAAGLGALALARHEFADALEWGQRSVEINPRFTAGYGVAGDAQIELGRYDEAIATFQTMVDLRPDLSSFSRVSYARELHGDVPGAIDAMQRAAQAGAGTLENVAWTQMQIGNLFFNMGDLDGATAQYNASLETLDGYVYGLTGLGRLAAARGDFAGAIDLYQQAIRTMPLPEFVIVLGDLYLVSGNPAEAAKQYALVDAMQKLYQQNGVNVDIEMALFDADHDRNLETALKRARDAYTKRPSIKVADVLAWTLYKTGNTEEARRYSQEALRLGTKDALMLFHAAMIEAELGNRAAAIDLLQRALAINPNFSVLYAAQARTTLAQLQAAV